MLEVVAALIEDPHGLITAGRRAHGHWKGCWEFPGGKVEPGESHRDALRRELAEELCVEAEVGSECLYTAGPYMVPRSEGEPQPFTVSLYKATLAGPMDPKVHDEIRQFTTEELHALRAVTPSLPDFVTATIMRRRGFDGHDPKLLRKFLRNLVAEQRINFRGALVPWGHWLGEVSAKLPQPDAPPARAFFADLPIDETTRQMVMAFADVSSIYVAERTATEVSEETQRALVQATRGLHAAYLQWLLAGKPDLSLRSTVMIQEWL